MINNGYTWRNGVSFRGDANLFAEQLQQLKAPNGTIEVDEVLDAQRPEDAPLHEDIEWDDAAAAYRYRINTITDAMGALRVIPVDVVREEPMPPVRALVPTRTVDKENGTPRSYYFTVSTVEEEETNINEMVRRQAISDLRSLTRRIASMPGCQDIADQLEQILSTF